MVLDFDHRKQGRFSSPGSRLSPRFVRGTGSRGGVARGIWLKNLEPLGATDREAFELAMSGDLPATFSEAMSEYRGKLADEKPQMATRASSGRALEVINRVVH